MKLARSTYYYCPRRVSALRKTLEKRIAALCAEFPRYGYRRITAQLCSEGMNVNHKAVASVMRKRGLQVRPLRRFVLTTNSRHDSPIFPNHARDFTPTAPDQLWVADITYIGVARGFVYLAVILDAWSRRVVGYALGRQIDPADAGGAAGRNQRPPSSAGPDTSFRSRRAGTPRNPIAANWPLMD
jgi:putative transposase